MELQTLDFDKCATCARLSWSHSAFHSTLNSSIVSYRIVSYHMTKELWAERTSRVLSIGTLSSRASYILRLLKAFFRTMRRNVDRSLRHTDTYISCLGEFLTLWRPLLPDRVKPSFVIFDILALWRSALLKAERQSARMSKITNGNLSWSGTTSTYIPNFVEMAKRRTYEHWHQLLGGIDLQKLNYNAEDC